MSRTAHGTCFLIFLFVLIVASIADASPRSFTEDFSTTAYMDSAATTAAWDTTAGELRLPAVEPKLLSRTFPPEAGVDVLVAGNYAFVACLSGFQIYDVSDPVNPSLIGSHGTPYAVRKLAVDGDDLFIALGGVGLQIYDISNPAAPALIGTSPAGKDGYSLAVDGDRVYMACDVEGLVVFNVADPANPGILGKTGLTGRARDVALAGGLLYVAGYDGGVMVVDISNPAAPVEVTAFPTTSARGLALDGDLLYVADYTSGVRVLDVANPAAPVQIGALALDDRTLAVTLDGNYLYACDYAEGLKILDVSDPTSPAVVDTFATPSFLYDTDFAGGLLYLVDYSGGLMILDQFGPPYNSLVGSGGLTGVSRGLDTAGDFAFVANTDLGLLVFDVEDLTTPVLVDSLSLPGSFQDVVVRGNYAFVASSPDSLEVVDISDPAHVVAWGSCPVGNDPLHITLAGDYAYVGGTTQDLAIVDISDPTAPSQIATLALTGHPRDIAIAGNYAFVADWNDGLVVVDITDPTTPVLVTDYLLPSYFPNTVAVADDRVFLGGNGFFMSIGISDPTAPDPTSEKCYFQNNFEPLSIQISGCYAYVGGIYGLDQFDISGRFDLAGPTSSSAPGEVNDLRVAGNHALAGTDLGLSIAKLLRDDLEINCNRGQSLVVDGADYRITRIRLTTTQSPTVDWELSADGGTHWQSVLPSGSWDPVTYEGADLLWRSTHTMTEGNPTVGELTLNWLNDFAFIDSIMDVPGDQGGWLQVLFTRSGRDFSDEATLPISNYGIWRRVDNKALTSVLARQVASKTMTNCPATAPGLSDMPCIPYLGEIYVQSPQDMATSSFPPGTWVWVATIPAVQQDTYMAAVPTMADSSATGTNSSVFVLTAHTTTPSIWYVSEPDSGYSVDNIAPGVPAEIFADYQATGVTLAWLDAPEGDFQYHRIYRSTDPGFVPGPANLVHETPASMWTDTTPDPWGFHYKITALDHAGNESEAGSPANVTGVRDEPLLTRTALMDAVPNPFNPMTRLSFEMAGPGHVRLKVYDTRGRLVATLVDGHHEAGSQDVIWDGRDNAGRMSSAGVYFYRLEIGDFLETKRMTLIK